MGFLKKIFPIVIIKKYYSKSNVKQNNASTLSDAEKDKLEDIKDDNS